MFELSDIEREAILLSLKVAFWAVAVSLPFGVACAWLLSRKSFPGKSVLNGIVHLPLVLPPVVVGLILLFLFGTTGPIGGFLNNVFGITVIFTWKGAAVAAAIMAFPLMVRAIRLSLDTADPGLERAARTLGAGPIRTFFTITLPLALPGLVTGIVLAFARGLGEFGATITFVSNIPGETRTLPLAIFSSLQVPEGEAVAIRLAVVSVILAFAALIASELLVRRHEHRPET